MSKKLLLSERFIVDLKNHLQAISSTIHNSNLRNYDLTGSDVITINVNKLNNVINIIQNILKNSHAYEFK